jgi:hypothetical protein
VDTSFIRQQGHVQLPNRVLLLCSPCASRQQVPWSASRVVPGAHRVVGPGTHRGSGPREVHTTRVGTTDNHRWGINTPRIRTDSRVPFLTVGAAPLLSSLKFGISKINRRILNISTPLDSPSFRTSDPRQEFFDSRGKSSRYFIQNPHRLISQCRCF